MHKLLKSRVHATHSNRVAVPQTPQSCEHCHKILAGVTAPWGKTQVCTKSECLLFAQTQDLGVIQTVRPEQLALLPGKDKSWYCGMVIAYEGDKKWTLGLVHDEANRTTEWIRGLELGFVLKLIADHSSKVVRKTESQITGYTKGPH